MALVRRASSSISDTDDNKSGQERSNNDDGTSNTKGASSSDLEGLSELTPYQAAPSDAASYGSVNFWDERYMESPDQFDWYQPYVVIRELIREYAKLTDEILMLGCGNSRMAEDMYYDGYGRITNVDYSAVVIEIMKEEYTDIPDLKWHRWNAVDLEAPDESYDVVLDKGTLDSILCSLQGGHDAKKALQEVERVLRPNGSYICMSVATPDQRLELLEDDQPDSPDFMSWEVSVHAVPKAPVGRFEMLDLNDMENYYYIYVAKKNPHLWDKKLVKMGKKKRRRKVKELHLTLQAEEEEARAEAEKALALEAVDKEMALR